jgi:hypothetical protein
MLWETTTVFAVGPVVPGGQASRRIPSQEPWHQLSARDRSEGIDAGDCHVCKLGYLALIAILGQLQLSISVNSLGVRLCQSGPYTRRGPMTPLY